MRCSRCHRQMKAAAVSTGNLTLGPRCAQIVGISLPRVPVQQRLHAPVVLPGQLPLFEVAANV